ncbi:hypothetical protein JTE90_001033 [Oedothorax gibbosus]|uniref:Uncharacterized protein n=1 Tax=Oedothorax gibbosus TaxID=931172 RepID=A0AAV6THE6_9ARAC|nr:hypothetical protein JTE90_001033 [Oedothorax gibbosus]
MAIAPTVKGNPTTFHGVSDVWGHGDPFKPGGFGSSHSASSASQKWPTGNSHPVSSAFSHERGGLPRPFKNF